MKKDFYGKKKAITFSFDDGVTQDEQLIDIFNKYGLKCTFNLNSSFFGLNGSLDRNGRTVSHNKISADKIKSVYDGHEIAVHTLTHPDLTALDEEAIAWQVERDRLVLSEIAGYEVECMAYPCGPNDDRVADVIARRTGVKFARTVTSTYSFDVQPNLLRYDPTVYYIETDKLFELGEKFVATPPSDVPQLFYVWGHSYEMDAEYISWDDFERFCKLVANRDDIFYGTNGQVLL